MAADQSLIDGLLKHAATLVTLLVAGNTVKTTDLVTVLQARIAPIKLALSAHAAFMAAVAAAHAEIANTAKLLSRARQALKIAFAGQVDTLADFGLTPPKPRTPLTAEQAAAVPSPAPTQGQPVQAATPASPAAPPAGGTSGTSSS